MPSRIARLAAYALASAAVVSPRGATAQSFFQRIAHCASPTGAAQGTWCLQDVPLFVPLRAESRSDVTKLMYGSIGPYPYAAGRGARTGMDISVGREIPLVGWGRATQRVPTPTTRAIGVWLPISFHMLWDLTDSTSKPIANTDYGFSPILIKAVWATSATAHPTSFHLRVRPIAHESSHLGDELTIDATKRLGTSFERVNVSQWYHEMGVGVLRTHDKVGHGRLALGDGLLTVRAGDYWLTRCCGSSGYYDDSLLTGGTVVPSRRRHEPYAQLEATAGWLFASAEVRRRIQYAYHRASEDVPERTQPSWNLVAGVGDPQRGSLLTGKVDLTLRYYHGVNPHGQFRSQRDYTMWGVGLHVGA